MGEFDPNGVVHLPTVPVHLSILPNKKVLFWGRDKSFDNAGQHDLVGRSFTYVWDMAEGSNKNDFAVWRPSEGNWYITKSSNGSTRITQLGVNGDVPVPADYDADGLADLAVFRPSTGFWHIVRSSPGPDLSRQWGQNGDVAVPRDYDADLKTDVAVYRPSTASIFVVNSATGGFARPFGQVCLPDLSHNRSRQR